MTPDLKIKPGLDIAEPPESKLDLAIIKVLGCRPWVPFCPSTDLNAAFAAVKRMSKYFYLHSSEDMVVWECKLVSADSFALCVHAETPALAICAAILKLKEVCP